MAPDLIALDCCIPHRRPAQSPERVLPRTQHPQAQGVCWLLALAWFAVRSGSGAQAAGSRIESGWLQKHAHGKCFDDALPAPHLL